MQKIGIYILIILFKFAFTLEISETNNIWGPGGKIPSPIELKENVTISVGDSLIINPGTVIVSNEPTIQISIAGCLVVKGVIANKVIFKKRDSVVSDMIWFEFIIGKGIVEINHTIFNNSKLSIHENNNSNISNCIFVNCNRHAILIGGNKNKIINNTIFSKKYGDGIIIDEGNGENIKNNIILVPGYAITCDGQSNLESTFNILNKSRFSYFSCLNEPSTNFTADPQFVDPENGDFHLKPTSPAIDAGDPSDDYSKEPDGGGGRINLGAYGNTPEATKKSASVRFPSYKRYLKNNNIETITIYSLSGKLVKHINKPQVKSFLNGTENIYTHSGCFIMQMHGKKSHSFHRFMLQ